MDKSNQWELYGDCSLCRRKKYCSKPCTKRKEFKRYYVKQAIREVIHERGFRVLEEYVDRTLDYM